MSSTITLRPTATAQIGVWAVVGAANAHTALSDNSDSSYVQAIPTCRLPVDVMAVAFSVPSIPTGSQIYSVGVRRRIQCVVGFQLQCCHWFRCRGPLAAITAIVFAIVRFFFGSWCPIRPIVAWVEEDLPVYMANPNGGPWTLSDFNTLVYEFGKIDRFGIPLRVSEVYLDVVYEQQSAVTVTAPTGTVTNTCRPTVTWTYASADSNPQAAYQVAVYSSAQASAVGFQPFVTTPTCSTGGYILGEDQQWTLSADIVNGVWFAYVQVKANWGGTGDFPSGVASGSWTQGVSGAPIANFTAATYDSTLNRVRLDFQPGAGSPSTDFYSVQVSQDGQIWNPVRGALLLAATGGPQTVYDYEAPIEIVSQYRILAYRFISGLPFPASDYSTIRSVAVTGDGNGNFWLKDPLNPLLNTPFPIEYVGDTVTRRRVQATYEPVSGEGFVQKIVVNGPQYGIEGSFNLIFHYNQPGDWFAAFETLDATKHTLLLQYPTGKQIYLLFGPGASGSDETYTWDSASINSKVKYRKVTVSYTEVDKPPITS